MKTPKVAAKAPKASKAAKLAKAEKAAAPKAQDKRQLHFFFVVDCSGSMAGDKMASLNYAVRSAIPAMRSAAADNPENDVLVRVVSYADKADWVSEEPVPVSSFAWKDLSAKGESAMGEALQILAKMLTSKKLPGRQVQPVIVLLSDGLPTDDVGAGLKALEQSEYGKSALRIAIAIGSDADMPTLQGFIGQSGVKPLQANNAENLVNRIKWAASIPVQAASKPISNGAEPLQQIAQSAVLENKDDGELLW